MFPEKKWHRLLEAEKGNVLSFKIDNAEFKLQVSTDGTDADITVPYGLAVNPENGDILVTDAKDYVTPGRLHCYNRAGVRHWSVTTGDIPGHITFVGK